jgi:integrase
VILTGLTETLKKLNVDYKGRNITFHSWRHWFCSKITCVIDSEKAAKVSGHLSQKIFRKYADHIDIKNIQEVGNAAANVFGHMLQFKLNYPLPAAINTNLSAM